jgi:hypothetical protein
MMGEMLDAVASWPTLVLALLVFGCLPITMTRLISLAFHRDDPRRHELLAEVRYIPRLERPLWVAEQLETAMVEGLGIYRWHLGSGVERNRAHPDSFHIPSDQEKALIQPGDIVKLMFDMKGGGERMWVVVTSVKGDKLKGYLSNSPAFIPRLESGSRIKFRSHHIIDLDFDDV